MSEMLCIDIADFVLKENLFSESTMDIYNAFIHSHGNENISSENIDWILKYIDGIRNTDRCLLANALAIDKQ